MSESNQHAAPPGPDTQSEGRAEAADGQAAPGSGYPGYPGYAAVPSYPAPVPGYPVPAPGYAGEQPQDPDNALGIVGLVLAVAACSPVGLIVSWVALNNSRKRGYKNTIALIGAILGGVFTALQVLALVIYGFFFVWVIAAAATAPALL